MGWYEFSDGTTSFTCAITLHCAAALSERNQFFIFKRKLIAGKRFVRPTMNQLQGSREPLCMVAQMAVYMPLHSEQMVR